MYTWGDIKSAALANLDLSSDEANVRGFLNRFAIYANEAMTYICSAIKPNRTFAEFVIDKDKLDTLYKMPDDFISFGDDVNMISYYDFMYNYYTREARSSDFDYVGYDKLKFYNEGTYKISYNATWFVFKDLDEDTEITAPADIVMAIPLYIASKCYAVDDEYKSAKYRNEFEMALARIDDTDFKQTKTFTIAGDW